MNKVLRATLVSAVVITTVIGIASFVLSFAALWDLATMAGVPRNLSWLWPVIVDGTILQATISVIALAQFADQRSGRRFFWWVLVIAALVSIGANALHAFTSNTGTLHPALSAAIATVAPVSLLAATHGLGILVRIPSTQPGPAAVVQTEKTVQPEVTVRPEVTVERDVESVGPDSPQSPPVTVVHATAENSDPTTEPNRSAELQRSVDLQDADLQGVELSDGIEDLGSAEPLDSVDRWILDDERIEDLYPVDAP
ncbi:DUF2637 domain-containing protein [Rhodococcus sp. H36-A4]|uniref:DUF2637 domain-containing protein n=1 Tax=Rhodococcus sp. H36-A4 TaxID=3004353 RepID=UPI0022AEDD1B|nr:DUF2637 domain-containing protein [Rhodococcus sp. H36-A4]MCZ4077981.1 DUF2637 domain-containing protein [Rhodococcus sp. H36-A4]